MDFGKILVGAGLGAAGGWVESQKRENDKKAAEAEERRTQDLLDKKEKAKQEWQVKLEKTKAQIKLEAEETLQKQKAIDNMTLQKQKDKTAITVAGMKAKGSSPSGASGDYKKEVALVTKYQDAHRKELLESQNAAYLGEPVEPDFGKWFSTKYSIMFDSLSPEMKEQLVPKKPDGAVPNPTKTVVGDPDAFTDSVISDPRFGGKDSTQAGKVVLEPKPYSDSGIVSTANASTGGDVQEKGFRGEDVAKDNPINLTPSRTPEPYERMSEKAPAPDPPRDIEAAKTMAKDLEADGVLTPEIADGYTQLRAMYGVPLTPPEQTKISKYYTKVIKDINFKSAMIRDLKEMVARINTISGKHLEAMDKERAKGPKRPGQTR